MNRTSLITLLLFAVLLLAIVAGGYFLTRNAQTPTPARQAGVAPTAERPAARQAAAPADDAPKHPELAAGLAALRTNDLAQAVERFARVPDTDPGYLIALTKLGETRAALGEWKGALAAFDSYIEVRPEEAEGHAGRGWILARMERYSEAELATLRAIELRPPYLKARYNLGLIRLAQGDVARAVPSYSRAMKRDTTQAHVYEGLEDLQFLRDRRPDDPNVYFGLAFFANALADPADEVAHLERYLELAPDGEYAELVRQNLEEARGRLEAVVPAG